MSGSSKSAHLAAWPEAAAGRGVHQTWSRHDTSSSSRLASWAVHGLGLTLARPHITEKHRARAWSSTLLLDLRVCHQKGTKVLGEGAPERSPGGEVAPSVTGAFLPFLACLYRVLLLVPHLIYKREISVFIKRKQPARPSLTVLAMSGAIYHFSSHFRAPAYELGAGQEAGPPPSTLQRP